MYRRQAGRPRYGPVMDDEDGYFGERVAARYDESSADMFEPGVVDAVVDVLAGLAGGGGALGLGGRAGRGAPPLGGRGGAGPGGGVCRGGAAAPRSTGSTCRGR